MVNFAVIESGTRISCQMITAVAAIEHVVTGASVEAVVAVATVQEVLLIRVANPCVEPVVALVAE